MYRQEADRISSPPSRMLVVIALTVLAGCGGQRGSAPAVQSSLQSPVSPQQVNVSPATMQIAKALPKARSLPTNSLQNRAAAQEIRLTLHPD